MAKQQNRHLRSLVQSYLGLVGSEVVAVKRLVKDSHYELAVSHLDQMLTHTLNATSVVKGLLAESALFARESSQVERPGQPPVEAPPLPAEPQPAMALAEEPASATTREEVPPSFLGELELETRRQ
jgi:hypothetical protein